MFTLIFICCLAAIFCFFSQEFVAFFKKVFDVWGAKTLLPLAIASWFVYEYKSFVLMVLTEIYDVLHDIIEGLDYFIPFKTIVPSITLIIILTAISVVPIHILNILSERKHHELYRYPYITSTLIWIVAALLFITH